MPKGPFIQQREDLRPGTFKFEIKQIIKLEKRLHKGSLYQVVREGLAPFQKSCSSLAHADGQKVTTEGEILQHFMYRYTYMYTGACTHI